MMMDSVSRAIVADAVVMTASRIGRWDTTGAAKLFLSLLVVLLHVAPFGLKMQDLVRPICRIAPSNHGNAYYCA